MTGNQWLRENLGRRVHRVGPRAWISGQEPIEDGALFAFLFWCANPFAGQRFVCDALIAQRLGHHTVCCASREESEKWRAELGLQAGAPKPRIVDQESER